MLGLVLRSSNASFVISRHTSAATSKTEALARTVCSVRQCSSKHKNKAKIRLRQASSEFSHSNTDNDEYMRQAIALAKLGSGHTYPNPPVGCILVDDSTGNILGKGFHPRAGYPHAEIFALFEAAGHVPSGTDAARSIVEGTISEDLAQITETYKQKGGQDLFSNCCSSGKSTTTAYVTLEPCCHYGQTPPCALSLVHAGISRVVIGIRDPNPRVDGGGVRILQEAGITVESTSVPEQKECRMVARNFLKRITPGAVPDNYDFMTGKHRRALRALAGDWQRLEKMIVIPFGNSIDLETVDTVELSPEWLEFVDGILWKHELVKFKLIRCEKKKAAKLFGDRLAQVLRAHVAQVVGHTMILYRPGVPPVLDLETLIRPKEDPESSNHIDNNNTTMEEV
jgi:diaminohydroxyphosphoribosylaminopyrimidine deaminase/5-amino-6-(5-phosphoribosylamino)uracil reductase